LWPEFRSEPYGSGSRIFAQNQRTMGSSSTTIEKSWDKFTHTSLVGATKARPTSMIMSMNMQDARRFAKGELQHVPESASTDRRSRGRIVDIVLIVNYVPGLAE
jgi:hypothetical protein